MGRVAFASARRSYAQYATIDQDMARGRVEFNEKIVVGDEANGTLAEEVSPRGPRARAREREKRPPRVVRARVWYARTCCEGEAAVALVVPRNVRSPRERTKATTNEPNPNRTPNQTEPLQNAHLLGETHNMDDISGKNDFGVQVKTSFFALGHYCNIDRSHNF